MNHHQRHQLDRIFLLAAVIVGTVLFGLLVGSVAGKLLAGAS